MKGFVALTDDNFFMLREDKNLKNVKKAHCSKHIEFGLPFLR